MVPEGVTPAEKVAATVLAYYRQLDALRVTAREFACWFDARSPADKVSLVRVGLAQSQQLPAFRRFLLEKRGHSMPAYMRAHLTPQELSLWADDAGVDAPSPGPDPA
ncbi:hypothetical protein AUC43_07525 [Hymenobacter sedentarius]|uniref:Uncharacterized protein n=1 Tax=Hymenobacter sedentarius TaxID=1411621 RepID=A0A0U4BMH3_9BACT|nr:hypothetical protein [Hymenobacter sedentarius]ALW84954.1 hypothetical protein AUC43_07525 [Hymenobacter sedentarius]